MARKRKRRKDRARQRASGERRDEASTTEQAQRFPDPRLPTFRVEAIGGVPVTEETFVFLVDRLRLPNGKVLAWHAPLVPALYLLTAKALLDAGEPERQQVLEGIVAAPERDECADMNVNDDSLAMDAIGKIGSAVILAAGAIEAYANEAIDRLSSTETVDIERRGVVQTVQQPEMVRRLSLEEKLDLVVPKVVGTTSIKGREPWPRFKRLNELRGEVVHVKARGRTDDPDVPSAVGRLMLGEGSSCVEDAASVILAYEPTWLPEATRSALGIG